MSDSHPIVGMLVAVGTLVVLAFASLEGTFSLFLRSRMGWDPAKAAFAFAFLGLISAGVQGGLIRRLVPKYGESRLTVVGIVGLSAGLALIALSNSVPTLVLAITVVAVGQGLVSPGGGRHYICEFRAYLAPKLDGHHRQAQGTGV